MGDKDFIKPLLERRGTVFFGKVGALGTTQSECQDKCLPFSHLYMTQKPSLHMLKEGGQRLPRCTMLRRFGFGSTMPLCALRRCA